LLLDTKLVPILGYKRSKIHSDFADRVAYGQGAAGKLQSFGFKLVLLSSCEGLPLVYNLVPANTDERLAAESVLYEVNDVIFSLTEASSVPIGRLPWLTKLEIAS
jgi:hypothetical protein